MAGVQFNFDISGLPEVQAMVADLQRRGENTQTLMLAVAQTGMQMAQHRFDLQRGPDGKPWLPSMAARREGRKTLIKTRHFRDETFSAEATNDTATWGTNAVQGRIFQLGGTIHMPAREGTARLRLTRGGALMRQSAFDRMGPFTPRRLAQQANAAVFAKASHKNVKSVSFKAQPYTINVVARPFLGVDPLYDTLAREEQVAFTGLIEDHYFNGLQGLS